MINSRFFMTSSLEHRTREVSTVHTPPLGGLPVNRPCTASRPGVELQRHSGGIQSRHAPFGQCGAAQPTRAVDTAIPAVATSTAARAGTTASPGRSRS